MIKKEKEKRKKEKIADITYLEERFFFKNCVIIELKSRLRRRTFLSVESLALSAWRSKKQNWAPRLDLIYTSPACPSKAPPRAEREVESDTSF
jgi:hypothetical protein